MYRSSPVKTKLVTVMSLHIIIVKIKRLNSQLAHYESEKDRRKSNTVQNNQMWHFDEATTESTPGHISISNKKCQIYPPRTQSLPPKHLNDQ